MMISPQAEIYQDGNVRLQLMREDIPITKRLRNGFYGKHRQRIYGKFSL